MILHTIRFALALVFGAIVAAQVWLWLRLVPREAMPRPRTGGPSRLDCNGGWRIQFVGTVQFGPHACEGWPCHAIVGLWQIRRGGRCWRLMRFEDRCMREYGTTVN